MKRTWARLLLLGPVLYAGGCATVVVPPPQPAKPQQVFLLEHGGHASLVLPNAEGGVTRYSYGDWRWYALGRKNVFTGVAALFWPTRAALGRRDLPAHATAPAVREAVLMETRAIHEITVPAELLARLRDGLEAIYRQNRNTRVFNAASDLELVQHPCAYTAAHNSNRVVINWLLELGCTARSGSTLFPRWKVQGSCESPEK